MLLQLLSCTVKQVFIHSHWLLGDANSGMADAGCGAEQDHALLCGERRRLCHSYSRRAAASIIAISVSPILLRGEVRLVSDPAERAISERNRRNEKKAAGGEIDHTQWRPVGLSLDYIRRVLPGNVAREHTHEATSCSSGHRRFGRDRPLFRSHPLQHRFGTGWWPLSCAET
jgi:hypothetical protein